jgi:hypothetical protein
MAYFMHLDLIYLRFPAIYMSMTQYGILEQIKYTKSKYWVEKFAQRYA